MDSISLGSSIIQIGSETSSWIRPNNTGLPRLAMASGAINDIASNISIMKNKKIDERIKLENLILSISHYSTFLTQFYANFPLIMGLRTMYEMYETGYLFHHMKHMSIPSIISHISNISFNTRMLYSTGLSRFGHTYYGHLRTHPKLKYLHEELEEIHPLGRDVIIGRQVFDLGANGMSYIISSKNIMTISARGQFFKQSYRYRRGGYIGDAERTIALHEFSHLLDRNLNKNWWSTCTTSQTEFVHDSEWASINKMMYMKSFAFGRLTKENILYQNALDTEVLQHRETIRKSTYTGISRSEEIVDFRTTINMELNKYRTSLSNVEQQPNDINDTNFKNYLKRLPIPLRMGSDDNGDEEQGLLLSKLN